MRTVGLIFEKPINVAEPTAHTPEKKEVKATAPKKGGGKASTK